MKVADLIAELQEFDPEQEVHFAYPAGDYWRTTVAPKVASVEPGWVKRSEYHRMPAVVPLYLEDETEAPNPDVEGADSVCLIRAR